MGFWSDVQNINPFEEITKALGQLVTTGVEYGKGVFYTKSGRALEEIAEGLMKEGGEAISSADKRAYEARRLMGPLPAGTGNVLLIGAAVGIGFLLFRKG